MKFSIIIINYNTFKYTSDCLNSIFEKLDSSDLEVIIVDNASPDGSGERLKKVFQDRVKFILNYDNLGFGKANNIGAKIASGKYLFFLNSDTLIDDVNLNFIDRFMMAHEDIGILGLDLLLENKKRQEYAFGDFLSLKNIIKKESNIGEEHQDYFEVDWASGAAIIVRKDRFNSIRGFDENFFMYFEDMDICRRIKKDVSRVLVAKKQSVIHFGGKSSRDSIKMNKDYYVSQDYYFKKFFGFLPFFVVKFLRFFYLLMKKQ